MHEPHGSLWVALCKALAGGYRGASLALGRNAMRPSSYLLPAEND